MKLIWGLTRDIWNQPHQPQFALSQAVLFQSLNFEIGQFELSHDFFKSFPLPVASGHWSVVCGLLFVVSDYWSVASDQWLIAIVQ